jgi:hypothetical protein
MARSTVAGPQRDEGAVELDGAAAWSDAGAASTGPAEETRIGAVTAADGTAAPARRDTRRHSAPSAQRPSPQCANAALARRPGQHRIEEP